MSALPYILAVFTMAALLPCSSSAHIPEGTAVIIRTDASLTDHEILYSSFHPDEASPSASTVFFNDGFGRLTMFEKEYKDGKMTITIRQNMNIVYKNTYTVSNDRFSVERFTANGRILFRLHVGERILIGEIDSHDKWIITEAEKASRKKSAVPLTANETGDYLP